MKKRARIPAINFEVVVDGRPMEVVATPFITADEKKRFRVSYDGSPVHIFELNEAARRIEVVDSASETIPLHVEREIGNTLLRKMAA